MQKSFHGYNGQMQLFSLFAVLFEWADKNVQQCICKYFSKNFIPGD